MTARDAISCWLDCNGFVDGVTKVFGVIATANRQEAVSRILAFICELEGNPTPSVEQVEARLFTFSYGDMVLSRFNSSSPAWAGPLAHPSVRSFPVVQWACTEQLVEQIARMAIQQGEQGMHHLSLYTVGQINALKPRDSDNRVFGRPLITAVIYELASPTTVRVTFRRRGGMRTYTFNA